MSSSINRRQFSTAALGATLTIPLMRGFRVSAQDTGTPAPDGESLGYAVVRIQTLKDAALLSEMGALVVEEFVPKLQELPGYAGYLLADSTDDPNVHLTISLFDNQESSDASTEASAAWVATLDEKFQFEDPVVLNGNLLIVAGPSADATPEADEANDEAGGAITIRRYHAEPGTHQPSLAPSAESNLLPLIQSTEGFQGYFWFPVSDGRVTISLFDDAAGIEESSARAADWVAENRAETTDTGLDVYTGEVVFADLPILAADS